MGYVQAKIAKSLAYDPPVRSHAREDQPDVERDLRPVMKINCFLSIHLYAS